MNTQYPLLYSEKWIRHFYVNINSFMDAFCNGAEEITDSDESFEFLYEWYMQNIMGWIELPEEYVDEFDGNDRDAEVEVERIMMFILPMVVKRERGLKRVSKKLLKEFHEKMESWLYDSEEEKIQWYKDFKKLFKINLNKDWGCCIVAR
jgi:hypothetical protein